MIRRIFPSIRTKLVTGHSCSRYSVSCRESSGYLSVSDEVAKAIQTQKPVVALETAILTHGLPYPDNFNVAVEVESIIREQGAVPATIGAVDGEMIVGLSRSQLEYLAHAKDAVKVSRRDIAAVISQGLSGGTTVSGTMVIASRVGIPIFVTGGIGGVHRDVAETMDISADLRELGHTPVNIICSGAKSILDIGRTLEYLETEGVAVVTFGQSKDFPAFYTPTSSYKAPYNVQTVHDAARFLYAHRRTELSCGTVIAVPIPVDCAADGQVTETAIQRALQQAKEQKVSGRDITPFVLDKLRHLTAGASLRANIGLVKNNALFGAQIAVSLSEITRSEVEKTSVRLDSHVKYYPSSEQVEDKSKMQPPSEIVVVGGTIVDYTIKHAPGETCQDDGGTYRGFVYQSFGGVGRNIADALSRLGRPPLFLSAVGDDSAARQFFQQFTHMNLSEVQQIAGSRTAVYGGLFRNTGDLIYGIGDFDVHKKITIEMVSRYESQLSSARLVCMDCNIPTDTLEYIADVCKNSHVPVWVDPTDSQLVERAFGSKAWKKFTCISPNLHELLAIRHILWQSTNLPVQPELNLGYDLPPVVREVVPVARQLAKYVPLVLVKMGKHGVLLCHTLPFPDLLRTYFGDRRSATPPPSSTTSSEVHMSYHPADNIQPVDIVNVSGAGDCLVAAVISGMLDGRSKMECMAGGMAAARLSLVSQCAVPLTLSASVFNPVQ